MKILVLNGPNINFLGIREKGIYGNQDYDTLVKMIEEKAQELGVEVEVFQSNYVAFLLYDRALHNLLMLYRLVWQPKLHRMLGMH